MDLTRKQVSILEDVFNYAVNHLDEITEGCAIFEERDGTWNRFDKDKKVEEILELWEYFKKNIKITEGNNESNN